MKNVCCLVITILILITSVGCNNSTQKENEEVLTASGYILDVWEDKELYNNALFYNSETEEYSKIIIDNIDKYYNNDCLIGGRSDYIKIYYTKNNKNMIISNIKPLKEAKNTKSFWIHNSPDKTLSCVKSFCGFEYSVDEPVDFFDAAHFFMFFNYANNFNSLKPKAFIGEDGVTHHYYKKDEFLCKVKEFFPTFDTTQVYKLSSLGEYSKDQPNYLQYDKENDLIYAFDGYSLSGAGTSFVKNYEKLDNNIFKATIVEIDYRIKTIEEVLYEYRLNKDGSVYLIKTQRKPARISNFTPKQDFSEYNKYIDYIVHSQLISSPWDSPESILPDNIIDFFNNSYLYDKYWDKKDLKHKVPFDVVFDYSRRYFNISQEYLKSSNFYDENSKCFIKVFGSFSNCYEFEIYNVTKHNNIITVDFYIFIPKSHNTKSKKYKDCNLTIEITDDNEGFKYLSYN